MILPPLPSVFSVSTQFAMIDSLPKNHKESRDFFPLSLKTKRRRAGQPVTGRRVLAKKVDLVTQGFSLDQNQP